MTPAARILREKRRLIWPIAIVFFVNVAVFVALVYPMSQKVANGEQDAQASAVALEAARQDVAGARATVAGKTEANAELQRFYAEVLPPDVSGARRIMYLRLDQLARDSNLHLARENMSLSTLKESNLVKVSYTASLSGEYRDIRRFIHAIETAPEFLVLEQVQLQGDEEKGIVNLSVEIGTYFRAGGDGN